MSEKFELDHRWLANDSKFAAFAAALGHRKHIDSPASFNDYCRTACRIWREQFGVGMGETSALFADLFTQIERHGGSTIPTAWGGVVVTLHEPPRVEKYLVVRQGGYLALEKHAAKDEHLEVREGAGLLLLRRGAGESLAVEALASGGRFHFKPGMEHCLIGTENLLVFESGVDPKGMDQDLIFLYEPDGSAA